MEIEEKMREMHVLATKIVVVSKEIMVSADENDNFRLSAQRKRKHSKNEFISQLMTLIADCRKMNLSEGDRASLDVTVTRLNNELYAATSLTIV